MKAQTYGDTDNAPEINGTYFDRAQRVELEVTLDADADPVEIYRFPVAGRNQVIALKAELVAINTNQEPGANLYAGVGYTDSLGVLLNADSMLTLIQAAAQQADVEASSTEDGNDVVLLMGNANPNEKLYIRASISYVQFTAPFSLGPI